MNVKHNHWLVAALAGGLTIALTATPARSVLVYINKNAPGPAHDGTSWPTAFLTVQAGIDAAMSGDELWVAASAPASQAYAENLTIRNGLALYGGFTGSETSRLQRNWKTNPTILDGNQTGAVLWVETAATKTVTVDGFTIRNGSGDSVAGGVLTSGGSTNLTNIIITDNKSRYTSGVRVTSGTVTISASAVTRNTGGLTSGAISAGAGNVTVVDSVISGNNSDGIYLFNSTVTVTVKNSAITGNGGSGLNVSGVASTIAVERSTISGNKSYGVKANAVATFANNTISGNWLNGVGIVGGQATITGNVISANGGYGVGVSSGTTTLTNNTITGNAAHGVITSNATLRVCNTVVAFNAGSGVGIAGGGKYQVFSHNLVYGNTAGEYYAFTPPADQGNISLDPMLSDRYSRIHLLPGSPCIDAGDDTAVQAGSTDFYGKPRIFGPHVDIGADEFDGNAWPSNTRTWHVSPSGTDGADGLTWGTAKGTVSGTLGFAQGGDEVWVARGAYSDTVALPAGVGLYGGFAGTESDLGQRNVTANPSVLDGGNGSVGVVSSRFPNSTVDGFTLRNGKVGVDVYGGNAIITNNTLTGNKDHGILVRDGSAIAARNTISSNLENGVQLDGGSLNLVANKIQENSSYGVLANAGIAILTGNSIYGHQSYGVQGQPASNLTLTGNSIACNNTGVNTNGPSILTGNTIYANAGVGIRASSTSAITNNLVCGNAGDAVYVGNGGQVALANNTITSNTGQGVHVLSGGSATVDNTIVAFNGEYAVSLETGGQIGVFSHNDVYANTRGGYSGYTPADPSNISVDPMLSSIFRTPHLQPGSPCIDAGNDAAVVETTDCFGKQRRIGARVDIGADESDGTLWTIAPRTLHVSPSGDDKANGLTWASAMKTVAGALSVAQSADEVWVEKGNYTATLHVPNGVGLFGGFAGGEAFRAERNVASNQTVLDRTNRPATVVTCMFPNVVVDGFTIRNGSIGVRATETITLANNQITGNFNHGVMAYGNATLINNVIANNAGNGVYAVGGTVFVSGCIISANAWNGVQVDLGVATLINDTISGNLWSAIYLTSNGTATAANNILAFNTGYGVKAESGATFTGFHHNDVYGNSNGDYFGYTLPTGQGNIAIDPRFTDRTSSNYELQSGSPCIDAGDDSAFLPGETDIDGQPRRLGAHVDIGADEFAVAGYYTMADAALVLRAAAGLSSLDQPGYARLNVVLASPSEGIVDILDAISVARKAAGVEANP